MIKLTPRDNQSKILTASTPILAVILTMIFGGIILQWLETGDLGFAGNFMMRAIAGLENTNREDIQELVTTANVLHDNMENVAAIVNGNSTGLPAYEISNHAAPGAECRHNLLYWHYGNYAGIGPGAHARLKKDNQKYAVERRKLPERWLQMVETEGHGTRKAEALEPNDRLVELVLMGLRTLRGIPYAQFLSETGKPIENCLNHDALDMLLALNLLSNERGVLRATASGRTRLNTIIDSLLA